MNTGLDLMAQGLTSQDQCLRAAHTTATRQTLASALKAERQARCTGTSDEWLRALLVVTVAANNHLGADEHSTASTN